MPDYLPNTVLWKLVIFTDMSGISCQNVFHFWNKELIPQDALPSYTADVIDEWNTRILEFWKGVQSVGVAYIKAINTTIIPALGPFREFDYAPGVNGGISSDPIPTFSAMVISKQTGFSGRSKRGRFYLPGVAQIAIDVNDLLDPYHTLLQEIANELTLHWGPLGSSTRLGLVLYSHKLGDVGGHPTLAGVTPINKCTAHGQIFTQRHRLKGVGI